MRSGERLSRPFGVAPFAASRAFQRVALAYPEVMGAFWDSDPLDKILSNTFPKIYGPNWLATLAPLNLKQVKRIIQTAMYYYRKGYSFGDYKSFKNALKSSLKDLPPLRVVAVASMVSGIHDDKFPSDVYYLKHGQVNADLLKRQNDLSFSQAKDDLFFEAKDKLSRGASAVVTAAQDATDAITKALPWYLKPKLLAVVGGTVGILFLLGYSGAGRVIFRSKEKPIDYKKNPISKKDLADAKYKEFHSRKPRKTRAIAHIDTEHLVDLGKALEIGYRSDKWTGKNENYLHKFGKGVRLMATPDGKNLVISGGKLGVKDVGIIN